MTDTHRDAFPELPCQDLVEVVTDYLDGALSEVDRRRFEAHLAECESCVAYVEQIRLTIAASGQAGRESAELPDDLREGLRRAFRDWTA